MIESSFRKGGICLAEGPSSLKASTTIVWRRVISLEYPTPHSDIIGSSTQSLILSVSGSHSPAATNSVEVTVSENEAQVWPSDVPPFLG